MKIMTILIIIVLLVFSMPAFGELTQADIDKIRLIIKEEVEIAVTRSEARMKEYVSQEIDKVNTRISEMDKRLTDKIDSLDARLTTEIKALDARIVALDKGLNRVFMLVLALVAFIAVVIGIPQILVVLQRKEVRAQDEKIEAQQKRIQALEKEMEVYRQEHV